MPSFITQVFINGQTVNQTNMNETFKTPPTELSAYFPITPSIPSGIGTLNNKFGQVGTTNVFDFTNGYFRFADQGNPINSVIYPAFTYNTASSITITCPDGSSPQYYIVAALTQTQIDSYQYESTSIILPTAMTLAQIAAAAVPAQYLIICAITNTSGVYSVFIDSNCAFNYGNQEFLDISDNPITGDVLIGTRIPRSTFSYVSRDAAGRTYAFGGDPRTNMGFTIYISNVGATAFNVGINIKLGERPRLLHDDGTILSQSVDDFVIRSELSTVNDEVNTLTDELHVLEGNLDNGFSSGGSSGWYQKCQGSWMEQGGRGLINTGQTQVTISFPIPFSVTPYIPFVEFSGSTAIPDLSYPVLVLVDNNNGSYFTIRSNIVAPENGINVTWRARGKI